jgi:two-component system response regulator RegX3
MKLHHVPARILVATPDRYLLTEYGAALYEDGVDASTATSGVQCLEQLGRIIPDLVVLDTDLLWGGADGVLAVLADDPAFPAVPAMVVSSQHSRSALYRVARFIVADYQLKPLSGKRLLQRIRLLLASNSKLEGNGDILAKFQPSEARTII